MKLCFHDQNIYHIQHKLMAMKKELLSLDKYINEIVFISDISFDIFPECFILSHTLYSTLFKFCEDVKEELHSDFL